MMQKANYGPFYCAGVYPKLAEIFREHGYALAVHGSVASDFDLIAVPWIDAAAEPAAVIAKVFERFVFDKTDPCEPTSAPHGLVKYKLHMSFGSCSLDICFVPRLDLVPGGRVSGSGHSPEAKGCSHGGTFRQESSPSTVPHDR